MSRLEGKVAVVTGGASGLGEATVTRFSQEGAKVVVADLDEAKAKAVAEALPGEAIGVGVDVGEVAATEALAAAALDAYGTIDVVFANAGMAGEGHVHDMPVEQWDRVIRVMLTGVYYTVRAVLPTMMERRSGSILLTASTAAVSGVPNGAAYGAAKAGVVGLTRQMAVDYAQHGIRVNAIAPGTIVTPLVHDAFRQRVDDVQGLIEKRGNDVPLGHLGEPMDVAHLATFLASDEAKWITGQVHVVDGGITMAMAPSATEGVPVG